MNNTKRKNVPFKGKALKMQRVAYHEAAHAVFCVIFNQKFKYAQVDIEQNDSLVDGIEKRNYSDCSCQNCENKLKEVWMMIDIAGFVAENIFLSRNAHQEDVNWKRVERKLFGNMEDRDGMLMDFDILQQPSGSFTMSRTYISDFTRFHEDLKCVMDFHNFGRYQEKYEFRYECFFMYKCAQIWSFSKTEPSLLKLAG